jgi:bifunctional DNase/RNase
MLVSVRVKRLALDPRLDTSVVILGVEDDEREFPIWIGPNEAAAIAVQLAGKAFPRPLTHDLMLSVIDGFGGKLTKVAIDRVGGATIYAKLFLERDGQTLTLDARPSDSIAAALRAGAEIVVNEGLLAPPVAEFEEWWESAGHGNDEAAEDTR